MSNESNQAAKAVTLPSLSDLGRTMSHNPVGRVILVLTQAAIQAAKARVSLVVRAKASLVGRVRASGRF